MSLLPVGISGEDAGYQIERSLRFNSADSAYLNRTFSAPTNGQKFSFSFWAKRSGLSSEITIFAADAAGSSNESAITLNSGNTLEVRLSGVICRRTTQLFRDPSAWYHIIIVLDTTQATPNDRVKVYLNGTQITAFTTTANPTLNSTDVSFNTAIAHYLGRWASAGIQYFNGYLTETYFIDGQALTPSSFGQTNATTGVWEPIEYTGTYGTNGFYLNFSDNASTTTLGDDLSGNGNDWTTNNFSVTAGAGNDSLVDTPTSYGTDTGAGGEVRGNYCVLNPLSKTSPPTISNGNLNVSTTTSSASISIAAGTIGVSSGKWYWEVTGTAVDSTRMGMYVCDANQYGTMLTASTGAYGYGANGNKIQGDGTNWFGTGTAYGNTWTTNDVIGIALDLDNGKIWFSKNGTWQASGDPAAGTNAAFTSVSGNKTCGMYLYTEGSATTAVFNLGQRPFEYTAPSGFKALCTQNMSAGTVTTSGSFTGNADANGPFVFLNGVPTAMTINGNAITFGTHADKLANGFKVRSSSSSYNASGSNTYSVSTTGEVLKYEVAQPNP
jgi:hypothetical protein